VHLLSHLTPLLLLPAAALARRADALAAAALGLGFWAYAALVGGDFMAMGRFLVPGWSFAALVFAAALAGRGGLALSVGGLAVILGALSGFGAHLAPHDARAAFHFRWNRPASDYRGEYDQWRYQRDNARAWRELGAAMAMRFGPEERVVAGAIGAMGYASGVFVYDQNGLVTPAVLAAPQDPGAPLRSPGHDRQVGPEFFLPLEPEVLKVGLERPPDCAGDGGAAFAARIRDRWRDPLRAITDGYGVDLWRPFEKGDDRLLVWWARLPDGMDAEAADAALEARLAGVCAGP